VSETLHAPYQRDNRAPWIITADLCVLMCVWIVVFGATFCTDAGE
jgi:hypothetical protein